MYIMKFKVTQKYKLGVKRMLRPIDTQTVYQQTQEVASREQMHRQAEVMQQDQFSTLLKKEVNNKQDKVNEMQKGEKVDNDLNKNKKKHQQKERHKQKTNKAVNHPNKVNKNDEKCTSIDIRI